MGPQLLLQTSLYARIGTTSSENNDKAVPLLITCRRHTSVLVKQRDIPGMLRKQCTI